MKNKIIVGLGNPGNDFDSTKGGPDPAGFNFDSTKRHSVSEIITGHRDVLVMLFQNKK